MSCPSWQWHGTGSHWSPVLTLPVAPLWCDLGFVQNSSGNKAAANLRPNLAVQGTHLGPLTRPQRVCTFFHLNLLVRLRHARLGTVQDRTVILKPILISAKLIMIPSCRFSAHLNQKVHFNVLPDFILE